MKAFVNTGIVGMDESSLVVMVINLFDAIHAAALATCSSARFQTNLRISLCLSERLRKTGVHPETAAGRWCSRKMSKASN